MVQAYAMFSARRSDSPAGVIRRMVSGAGFACVHIFDDDADPGKRIATSLPEPAGVGLRLTAKPTCTPENAMFAANIRGCCRENCDKLVSCI